MNFTTQRVFRLPFLIGALLPVAVAALLLFLLPRHLSVLFEYDEGYNAMKTLLHMKGFLFYHDIWSDQPPLVYFLLDGWFSHWGATLLHGRVFTLLFSAVLLTAFYHLVRIEHGRFTAALAALFLLTSWKYVQLSLSLMEAVPSLAFAVLGLLCASAHARRPRVVGVFGAAVFATLALYSRLAMGLFPLLFLLRWALASRGRHLAHGHLLRTCALFLVFAALAGTAATLLLRPLDWHQMLGTHAAAFASVQTEYTGWRMVPDFLLKDYHLTLLAVAGLYVVSRTRSSGDLFAAAWLVLTLGLLLAFRPVWWHYHILLALPLSWLAARGIAGFLSRHYAVAEDSLFTGSARQRVLLIVFCVLIGGLMAPARLLQAYDFLRQPGFDLNSLLLASMRPFASQTRWMVTDDAYQAYPFHYGIPVPPELAVTSPKRIASGQLQPRDWLAALEKYRPEQAVFSSFFPFPPDMNAYLADHYFELAPSPVLRHFIRQDLTTAAWIRQRQDQLVLIANFLAFLRSEPDNDRARWQLAIELGKLGAAEESCDYFRQALRLNPAFIEAHNSLAWLLATHPDPAVRRPDEAIYHAETACAITHQRHPILLDTLAAAYANAGRFSDALATADKARAIADRAGATPLVEVIDRHRALYRQDQPFRESLFQSPPIESDAP